MSLQEAIKWDRKARMCGQETDCGKYIYILQPTERRTVHDAGANNCNRSLAIQVLSAQVTPDQLNQNIWGGQGIGIF